MKTFVPEDDYAPMGTPEPHTIEHIVKEEVDNAPGYYDKDLAEAEAKIRKLTDLLAVMAEILPDDLKVEFAKKLHYKEA